jgi:hypothetical protein
VDASHTCKRPPYRSSRSRSPADRCTKLNFCMEVTHSRCMHITLPQYMFEYESTAEIIKMGFEGAEMSRPRQSWRTGCPCRCRGLREQRLH